MSRGSHTKEYRLFLCNISRLSEGTSHAVEEFATKAHEKQLIATARVEEATCLYISSYIRASNLLQTLLTRIQLDSNIFYTVCDILKSIPALEPMADVLSTDDSPSTSDVCNNPLLTGSVCDCILFSECGATILYTTADREIFQHH